MLAVPGGRSAGTGDKALAIVFALRGGRAGRIDTTLGRTTNTGICAS